MKGKTCSGEHRFQWRTDFDFEWMGGWKLNQGEAAERNIICVIPGKNRKEAVVLGDHYDTAYMEDVYDKQKKRRSAAGADDNHSATAALLHAAEVLLPLAREGKLQRDVWLIHLTGEEFPSDCLCARHLAQRVVEGNFAITCDGVGRVDLSSTRVIGAFVLDMIAHNNDKDRYVFQIAPGFPQVRLPAGQAVTFSGTGAAMATIGISCSWRSRRRGAAGWKARRA